MIRTYRFNLSFLATRLSILLLSACATSSFFVPYTRQATELRQAVFNNKIATAIKTLKKKQSTPDGLLYFQESGRLNQLDTKYSTSLQDFDQAFKHYRLEDEKALVSLSDIGAKATSFLGNENNIPYTSKPFERILSHTFQAFNYLMANNRDAANVEIRRARNEQRRLELKKAMTFNEAKIKADSYNIDLSQIERDSHFSKNKQLTSHNSHVLLNAYTYYFSGIIWESQHQWNDARIDYQKAFELTKSLPLRQAVDRVKSKQILNEHGALVIIFEQGFVAQKQGFNLWIPSPSFENVISLALPYYDSQYWPETRPLTISHDTQSQPTEVIANISQLAATSLQGQYPELMIRQILRAVAKQQLRHELSKSSELGGIFAEVYNLVSEQADLRSWSTLPHTVQTTRLLLPDGKQQIRLYFGQLSESRDILIRKGEMTLMRVIDAGSRLITEVINL